jgi:hypothetical protein
VSCPVNYGNRKVWAKSTTSFVSCSRTAVQLLPRHSPLRSMGTHADDGGKIRIVSLTARLF